MKKSLFACALVLALAAATWAQSAQTSTSGSATVNTQAGQQPAPQPAQPAAGTTATDDDAQMTRPAPGSTPGQQPPANAPAQSPASGGQQAPAAGTQAATMVHAELSKTVDAKKAKVGDEISAKTTTDFRTAAGTRVPAGSKLLGRVTEAQKYDKKAGGQSKLAFVFDRAVLKDKTEMPVNVVVQAIGKAQASSPPPGMDAGADTMAGGQAGASGPGLVGGAAGTAGSTVGGVTGAAGQTVGAVGNTGAGAVGAATGAAGDVAGSATGAVDASGRLSAQSQGVVGLEGVQLQSAASGDAQAAVVTSDQKNVKLNSGTQLVLRVSAQ